MRRLVWVVLWGSMLTSCEARESTPPDPAAAGASAPTMLDRWNDLMRKAQEQAGAIKDYGQPRKVPRGAQPEIILSGGSIAVTGNAVRIGGPFAVWRSALPGEPRCEGDTDRLCVWDELGIQLSVTGAPATVSGISIVLNLERPEPWDTASSSIERTKEKRDYRPRNAFPGYLELDGYGIDAETKFWEIRKMADPKRNLRCGLRDCSHPHGAFSSKASLYLRLNRNVEYGTVYELSIAGDDEPQTGPTK